MYNYYYIDQEFYYMGKAYTRETHGGHFYQSAGTSTIKGSFYNGGTENIIIKDGPYPGGEFDPTAPQERLDALVEIENGGKFTVNGNFENGKNDPSIGCIDEDNCDYYGIGYLVAKGESEIIVGGDFKSDAQGDSFVNNGFYYRSSVDLQDSTLKVGGSFSTYRSNISLTGNSSIHANSFFLDKTASLNFIGSDTGFSFINATTSATFNGSVSFQLTGSLLKNDDMSYLILDTPLLQGSTLREGKVTVLDSTGQTLTNYITEIVKKDDQYLLAFCDVNTGCSSDKGGDTGDGEQGGSGNEGSGGDNQGGGNSGSDDKPTPPSPSTPPSSYI